MHGTKNIKKVDWYLS